MSVYIELTITEKMNAQVLVIRDDDTIVELQQNQTVNLHYYKRYRLLVSTNDTTKGDYHYVEFSVRIKNDTTMNQVLVLLWPLLSVLGGTFIVGVFMGAFVLLCLTYNPSSSAEKADEVKLYVEQNKHNVTKTGDVWDK